MKFWSGTRWKVLVGAAVVGLAIGLPVWLMLPERDAPDEAWLDLAGLAKVPEPAGPLSRGPIVQRVTPDGVTIMGKPARALLAEPITVTVTPDGGSTLSAAGRFDPKRDTFLIRVEGLPANTLCRYEVQIGAERVGPFEFMTAPPPGDKTTPFRFALYGDCRSNPRRHKQVADSMLASNPRFALILGDLVGHGPDRARWNAEFFWPAHDAAARVPMIPCYGNHESNAHYLTDYFDLPGNGHFFTVDYGCARIITLDLYQPYGPGSKQHEWFKSELARKWDGWLFVQFHEPPFGASEGRGFNFPVIDKLFPLLIEGGVDVLFCGHDHNYVRAKPIALKEGERGVVQIVSGGGGAPTYKVVKLPHAAVAYSGLHHVVIDVTADKLNGKAVTPRGKVVDEFVIEKGGPQPDLIVAPRDLLGQYIEQISRGALASLVVKWDSERGLLDSVVTATIQNPGAERLSGAFKWIVYDPAWEVQPTQASVSLAAGEKREFAFHVRCGSYEKLARPPAAWLKLSPASAEHAKTVEQALLVLNNPRASVPHVTAGPVVDGDLSDSAWEQAANIGPLVGAKRGIDPRHPTECRVLIAADGLYVAVTCLDDDLDGARANAATRDSDDCWMDDSVELFVGAAGSAKSYRHFAVSITGQVYDASGKDKKWDGEWQHAVKKSSGRWTVELKIPWSDLGFKGAPAPGQRIGFNVARTENVRSRADSGQWYPFESVWSLTGGSYHRPDRFGTLIVK